MTGLPDQCCTLPPFESDYAPIGNRFKIKVDGQEDVEVCSTGAPEATTVLVGIHDIFGLHNNTLQGADHLASSRGYRILIPDFFRGAPWPIGNIPPKEGRPVLDAWIQDIGSWEKVRPALLATIDYIKSDKAPSIGAYGFCFGAKKLVQAAHQNLFKAIALVHPSLFQPEDADNITTPVALLPSQGENKDIMDAFWEKIQKNNSIAPKSVRKDFPDVDHGFASARSNWADPRLAARAREAYTIMSNFFQETL